MINCLIIDDDQDDQEIFSMCARQVNAEIKCLAMADGVEAVAMLVSATDYLPDYIFIDVNMPKMNGIDCLKILKNMDRLRYSRIFMYSTTSENSVLAESKRFGAEDFLVKPPKTGELKEKLSCIFKIVSNMSV